MTNNVRISRVAVVTGSMGKLGAIWIEALLENGVKVYAIDKPGVKLTNRLESLRERYGSDALRFNEADIMEKCALEDCEKDCLENMGSTSILINNAGIDQPPLPGESCRLEDITCEQFLPTLEVNTYGSFQVSQVFGKQMIKNGGGSIINVGSLYASVSPDERMYNHIECDPPFIKPPAYGASKSALYNLTRYMAAHWAKYGVRVNMLSPGGVEGGQDPEFKRKFCLRVPMGRMAEECDLVGPLLFLATDASSYVTGMNLQVDGGFTIW